MRTSRTSIAQRKGAASKIQVEGGRCNEAGERMANL